MVIIWGTKVRKAFQGYCADFCPVCREVRASSLFHVREAFHLYYIPFGAGRLTGAEKVCTVCRNRSEAAPGTPVRADARDMGALLADVPESIRDKWAQRLAEEDRLRADAASLAPELRVQRMVELFADLESFVGQELGGDTKVDGTILKAFLLWCAIVATIIAFGHRIAEWPLVRKLSDLIDIDAFGLGMIAVLGSGFLILFYLAVTNTARLFRRQVFPKVVPHLHPLNPTRQELLDVKRILRKSRCKAGRFRVGQLARAIARYRPPGQATR